MEGQSLANSGKDREVKRSFSLQGRANLRAAIGYNNNDWTFGLYGIAHGDRYTLPKFSGDSKSGQIGNTQGVIRLVAARRFPMKTKKKKPARITNDINVGSQ